MAAVAHCFNGVDLQKPMRFKNGCLLLQAYKKLGLVFEPTCALLKALHCMGSWLCCFNPGTLLGAQHILMTHTVDMSY